MAKLAEAMIGALNREVVALATLEKDDDGSYSIVVTTDYPVKATDDEQAADIFINAVQFIGPVLSKMREAMLKEHGHLHCEVCMACLPDGDTGPVCKDCASLAN